MIQAIINDTQNNWMGFPFLFAICFAAMIGIAFVDVSKGREDARRFVEARKSARARAEIVAEGNNDGASDGGVTMQGG